MPEHISIAAQIQNLRASWDAKVADGTVTVIEAFKLVGQVGEIFDHIAETFVGDQAHFEQEISAGRAAYATYLAPIDIPGVPNFLEPWLDQGVITGLEQAAREARKRAIERNPELAGA